MRAHRHLVISGVLLCRVAPEGLAQFRRIDNFDVRGPFADFSFEFRVDPYAHGKEQSAARECRKGAEERVEWQQFAAYKPSPRRPTACL